MTTPFFFGWTPPEPFGGETLKPWPTGVFPEPFETFVHELARSTETPPELAALMTLAVVATAAQKRFTVQVKADYGEMLNLWTCVAMPSGSRKSPVLSECLIPVKKFEKMLIKSTEPLRKGAESDNKLLKSRLQDISSRAKTAKGQEFEALKSEALEIEGQIRTTPPPPQLWTSDVTPENLATIMKENDEAMSIISDEGGIFDILAGRYSKGVPNLDLVLQAHSGGNCRVNRSSRPQIILESPRLTMGLTPQPCVLEGLGNNKSFRGRGLLGRFLYALPTSNLGSRNLNEQPIEGSIVINYQEAVENLLKTCSVGNFSTSKVSLQLTEQAYETWKLNALVIELKMGIGGPMAHITDWAGKLPGAIARLAALLHLMRYHGSTPESFPISEQEMRAAIAIGNFLQSHAVEVFRLIGRDKRESGSKKVLDWILNKQLLRFSRRECHRALDGYFPKVDDLKPILALLVEHHYIRELPKETQGHRSSLVYEVNPYLYEGENKGP